MINATRPVKPFPLSGSISLNGWEIEIVEHDFTGAFADVPAVTATATDGCAAILVNRRLYADEMLVVLAAELEALAA